MFKIRSTFANAKTLKTAKLWVWQKPTSPIAPWSPDLLNEILFMSNAQVRIKRGDDEACGIRNRSRTPPDRKIIIMWSEVCSLFKQGGTIFPKHFRTNNSTVRTFYCPCIFDWGVCSIGGRDCISEQLLESVIASLCFFSWPCFKKIYLLNKAVKNFKETQK